MIKIKWPGHFGYVINAVYIPINSGDEPDMYSRDGVYLIVVDEYRKIVKVPMEQAEVVG
jgi:hypothetical protein